MKILSTQFFISNPGSGIGFNINPVQLLSFSIIMLINCCNFPERDYDKPLYAQLDIQGHRGCRGSLPENSLAGFIQALEWGVTTLEMDVVISKDRQVVLSHEPFLSHHICLDSSANELETAARFQYNIYQMTYEQIKNYDCGSKSAPGFPAQQLIAGPKPLLNEVIEKVEARTMELGRPPVKYNIEPKSMAGYDNLFHPDPATFLELVLAVINQYGIEDRTVIQCFDHRILQEVKKQQPELTTSLLVGGGMGPLTDLIQLGFKPGIYSPNYLLVNDSMVRKLHKQKIAVIPWTVNDTVTMDRLIKLGVDGIITDYPELLIKLVEHR